MKFFNRLQERFLQKDLKKERKVEDLVKKYPISLLIEKGILKRYKDTGLYCANPESGVLKSFQYTIYEDGTTPLYTISGESIGKEILQNRSYITQEDVGAPKYMIIAGDADFDNTKITMSYAIYDKEGYCIVPHGCYQNVYNTENYTILSLPEKVKDGWPVRRICDKEIDSYAKILGDSIFPHAIIVGESKIVTTKYNSIFPVKDPGFHRINGFATNEVWIGQSNFRRSNSIKIDKRMSIKETYELPFYIDKNKIRFDDLSKDIYYFNDTEMPPVRVNLRNGQEVDLMTLKKIEKAKTPSNKTESGLLNESMLFADDHTVL